MRYLAIAFAVGLSTSAVAAPFSAEDVFKLEYAQSPAVSPDGRAVAYVRTRMDQRRDRRMGEIWTVDLESGAHKPLVTGEGSYGAPVWSPNGDRLLFRASERGGARLRAIYLADRVVMDLADTPQTPSGAVWSPDGGQIAFVMLVPDETAKPAARPNKPKGAEWAEPVTVVDDLVFRRDGAGFITQGRRHVFLVPADGGSPRQVTQGDRNFGAPAWAPDGETLYVSANRELGDALNPLETEVFALDPKTGALTRLTTRDGGDFAPLPSPDGARIAFRGFDDQGFSTHQTDVYVMDRDGGSVRNLTADLDRDIEDHQWRGDGRGVYVRYPDEGRTVLASVDLNGRVTVLSRDLGGMAIGRPYNSGAFDARARGRRDVIAFTYGRGDRPADLAVLDGGDPRVLTDLNGDLLAAVDMAEIEAFTVESGADGQTIQAWIAHPPDFDSEGSYPLVLEIHGGPHASYGVEFSAEVQRFAAEGFVTVYANPRGSLGYGEAFALEIDKNYPSEDYDDLMSVVDAVIARGYVDDSRLFVTGGSGGGVLTAWIVGKTDRFAAAVVAKPVINWTSFVLSADNTPYFARYWFGAMPWEDPDAYWRRSPLSLVGAVTTPTMLLTGDADYRTPIWETEQYYTALKLRGVETAMVRVPGASHSIASRPSQLIDKVENILGWFERHDPANDADS